MKRALIALLLLAAPAFAIEGTAKVDSKVEDSGGHAIVLEVSKAQFDSVKLGDTIEFKQDQPTDPNPPVDPQPPTGLDPSKAPAQNFKLTNWKITLPVNSSGTLGGSAKEYDPIPLNLEVEPYFYTGGDGAMVFNAPVLGTTTGGSKYPRSELRELDDDGELAAWTVAEGGKLTATVAVTELPTATTGSSRVVIGQIHGPDDELCRLYFNAGGKLSYANDKSGSSNKELSYDLKDAQGRVTNIPLGAKFDYSIVVAAGKLTVSATYNGVVYSASETISSFWTGKACYFKAGMYCQVGKPGSSAGSTGTGTGTAAFYKLEVSH